MLLITLFFPLFVLSFPFSTKGRPGLNTAGGKDEALVHQIIISHIIIISHSFLHPFLHSAEWSFHHCQSPLRPEQIPSFSCWQWCPKVWRVKMSTETITVTRHLNHSFWGASPCALLYWNSRWQFLRFIRPLHSCFYSSVVFTNLIQGGPCY